MGNNSKMKAGGRRWFGSGAAAVSSMQTSADLCADLVIAADRASDSNKTRAGKNFR